MRRTFCGVLVLGLLSVAPAWGQPLRQSVYVDIDFTEAKGLEEKPSDADRDAAKGVLRSLLTKAFQETPRIKCWDLQPLPSPAPKQGHAVKFKFYHSKPTEPAISELKVLVYLVDLETNENKGKLLPLQVLAGVGKVEQYLKGFWGVVFDDIRRDLTISFETSDKIPEVFIEQRVPVAYGIVSDLPGGAALPLHFDDHKTRANSVFEINYYDPTTKLNTVRIISRGSASGVTLGMEPKSWLHVAHQFWVDAPFIPPLKQYVAANHDAVLKTLKPGAICVKEIGSNTNINPLTD